MSHILTTVNAPILSCSIPEKKKRLSEQIGGNKDGGLHKHCSHKELLGLNLWSILCCWWDKDSNTERLWGFYACCASTPGDTIHVWLCLHVLCSQSTFQIIRSLYSHKSGSDLGKLHPLNKDASDQLPNESESVLPRNHKLLRQKQIQRPKKNLMILFCF